MKTSGQTLYFTDEGIVFDLLRKKKQAAKDREGPKEGRQPAKTERLVFNLGVENVEKSVSIEGLYPQSAEINYFMGNDQSKWKRGILAYKGVVYKGIYKRIDLRVYGKGKDIEYEFIVNPGGNPDHILLTYNGIEGLATNGEGELLIGTAFGELKETKPYIYQEMEGKKEVKGRFEIRNADGSQTGKFSYGFRVTTYNPAYPLVIDPTLTYSTYLGGSNFDSGSKIAVDASGNAYVTGVTVSTDFPTQNPFQGAYSGGDDDAFITKFSPSGTALIYSTYLGGAGGEGGADIAVDGSGNAYVVGATDSTDFPTQNPFQGANAGSDDAFITKLSPSGTALIYSTYLGGATFDSGTGIAVDGSGNAYVTGWTNSTDFPTQNPFQGAYAGGVQGSTDAFITKLSSSGTALIYSTYLGGTDSDDGNGIAVDGSGNAYVAGETMSTDFPTQNPFQGTNAGSDDAFITKLAAAGNTLTYSTYLGGSASDKLTGIAVDGSGNGYVVGYTESTNFPTQNPFQGAYAGKIDAFITKLAAAGNTLTYSTYLGGTKADIGNGIAVDGSGYAYVTGFTNSTDFPTQNPFQGTFTGGDADVFITKLAAEGNTLTYSTYLGGNVGEIGNGIAVDSSGNAYVTGQTYSTNFPTQNPFQGTNAGNGDAFVTKLTDANISPPIPTLNEWGLIGLTLLMIVLGIMTIRKQMAASV